MPSTVVALARSTHPGPTVAVSAIAVILGFGVALEPWRLVVLGLMFLANQASVGLSNDWIDADRDRAVGRTDKPVAAGLVTAATARGAAVGCAVLAVALSLSLGPAASLAQLVFLAAGWSYNLWLKSTAFSVIAYAVGFGTIPLIVTLARSEPALASGWAVLAGALLGISAHFANTLPDLDDDRATGVNGLPHRLGLRASGLIIATALAGASASIVLGLGTPSTVQLFGLACVLALAVVCAVLVVARPGSRLVFRLIILGALVTVVLLAVSGQRLLA